MDGERATTAAPAWTTPTPFDGVKELNAHAGRLAAMLGFLLAATTYSLANGPVHDRISAGFSLENSVVFILLGGTGIAILWIATSINDAIDPSVALPLDDTAKWSALVESKSKYCDQASRGILVSVFWLGTAWLFAMVAPASGNEGTLNVFIGGAIGALVAVVVPGLTLVRLARRLRRYQTHKQGVLRQLQPTDYPPTPSS